MGSPSLAARSFVPTINKDESKIKDDMTNKTTQTLLEEYYTPEEIDSLSERFQDVSVITLPLSIERDIKRLLQSKKNYSIISNDQTLAIEKTLVIVSNLTSTLFEDKDEMKFKALKSKILERQVKTTNDNTYTYRKIICLLVKNNIIEIKLNKEGKEEYSAGHRSKRYKLNEKYLKMRFKTYKITSTSLIHIRSRFFYSTLEKSLENPICRNLIKLNAYLEFPTEAEIRTEAKKLIKENYFTNKGKKLTLLNGKSKASFKDDVTPRSFVIDSIQQFKWLTDRGASMPVVGSERAGGRVVDSFTGMPSWIRKMMKVNGTRLQEADYTCLHPNIAKTLYGGSDTNITHDIVKDYLNIERVEAKIEHLGFFNKHWNQMQKSPLFKYYIEEEPTMMKNLKKEKFDKTYKETSKRLFKAEVEIMTEVIIRLNTEDINAMYVYDAIMVEPQYLQRTETIMNQVAKEFKVNTTV